MIASNCSCAGEESIYFLPESHSKLIFLSTTWGVGGVCILAKCVLIQFITEAYHEIRFDILLYFF